ncbi:unnamed protein product [Fusarium langsethiae]|nr:unnamed protein product [Fusarium langsethiae]
MAGFYFWNAGMSLQKTSEGLLRTLLYQIFFAQPDLISQAHPRRWTLLQIFGSETPLPQWTTEELNNCLDTLATKAGKDYNLALFIDGLDEFEGDHKQLVNLFHRMNMHEGVKLCVSSRPWNIFEDKYGRGPMLRVENMTKKDIELFVRDKFSQSDGFQELRAMFPGEVDKLQGHIVDKAQGVFLWVAIVVEFWLEDLTEGIRLSNLQNTLDDIPDDVAKLFERIWNRIEPRFRPEVSEYFQLIEAMSGQDNPTFLQTLWLADKDIQCEFDLNTVTAIAANNACKNTKRRLNSRTKGLLDIYANGRVDYLHRTELEDDLLENKSRIRPQSCSIEVNNHPDIRSGSRYFGCYLIRSQGLYGCYFSPDGICTCDLCGNLETRSSARQNELGNDQDLTPGPGIGGTCFLPGSSKKGS